MKDVDIGLLPERASAATLAATVVALIQGLSVLARDGMDRDSLMRVAAGAMALWPSPGVCCR